MRLILLIAFVAFPLLELAVLVKLGGVLGFWPTFGIVIATGLTGIGILQRQGFAVLGRIQDAVKAGRTPLEPVVDGMFFLISGMLLISPGVIADALGLLLLVPLVRRLVAHWSMTRVFGARPAPQRPGQTQGEPRRQRSSWRRPGSAGNQSPKQNPPVIEGEFERVDEPPVKPNDAKPG